MPDFRVPDVAWGKPDALRPGYHAWAGRANRRQVLGEGDDGSRYDRGEGATDQPRG